MKLMRTSRIGRDLAFVSLSLGVVQISGFVLGLFAAHSLAPEIFGELSELNARIGLLTTIVDLGVSTSIVRFYGASKNTDYLIWGGRFMLALGVPLAVACLLIAVSVEGTWASAVFMGWLQALWSVLRARDLATGCSKKYLFTSANYAVIRIVATVVAIKLSGSSLVIAACLYAVPVVGAVGSEVAELLKVRQSLKVRVAEVLGHGLAMHAASVAFVGSTYIPWLVIEANCPAGRPALGLALTMCSPLALVVQACRGVILPRLAKGEVFKKRWDNTLRIAAYATGIWLAINCAGAILAIGLDTLYAKRIPDVGGIFQVYLAGYSATACIGIVSMRVFPSARPMIIIGAIRFLAVLSMLAFEYPGVLSVIWVYALILTAGELAQGAVAVISNMEDRQLR